MSRRVGRELALRALFMVEQGKLEPEVALEQARASLSRGKSSDPAFAEYLTFGALDNAELIDDTLTPHMHNWTMGQMSAVDRTLLRIAAFELLFTDEPAPAVIDEAVSLAKMYGAPESGRFVNGILGSLIRLQPPQVVGKPDQHSHTLPDTH